MSFGLRFGRLFVSDLSVVLAEEVEDGGNVFPSRFEDVHEDICVGHCGGRNVSEADLKCRVINYSFMVMFSMARKHALQKAHKVHFKIEFHIIHAN